MLIISQDKSGIFECKNIIINDNAEILTIFSDNTSFSLGKYESYEKCQDVINSMAKCYDCGYKIFQMPAFKISKTIPVISDNPDSFKNLAPYLTTYTYNLLARLQLTSIKKMKKTKLSDLPHISAKREIEILEAIKKYENS